MGDCGSPWRVSSSVVVRCRVKKSVANGYARTMQEMFGTRSYALHLGDCLWRIGSNWHDQLNQCKAGDAKAVQMARYFLFSYPISVS
jgi:hypothetical protein